MKSQELTDNGGPTCVRCGSPNMLRIVIVTYAVPYLNEAMTVW